jgi:hypothetical protein
MYFEETFFKNKKHANIQTEVLFVASVSNIVILLRYVFTFQVALAVLSDDFQYFI